MISNSQYKKDIRSLIKIIKTLYKTDCRSIDNQELVELQLRIGSIPDEEPKQVRKLDDKNPNDWLKPQHLRDDLPSQTGFDPNEARGKDTVTFMDSFGNAAAPENDEPHDMGNVLHIPTEDD